MNICTFVPQHHMNKKQSTELYFGPFLYAIKFLEQIKGPNISQEAKNEKIRSFSFPNFQRSK